MSSFRGRILVRNEMTPCGGQVTGTAIWSDNSRGQDVAALLYLRTQGRGDRHTALADQAELGSASVGEVNFSLSVPAEGPVTYHGSLLRVLWYVAIVVAPRGRPPRHDPGEAAAMIAVVPRGWPPRSGNTQR